MDLTLGPREPQQGGNLYPVLRDGVRVGVVYSQRVETYARTGPNMMLERRTGSPLRWFYKRDGDTSRARPTEHLTRGDAVESLYFELKADSTTTPH